MLAGALQAFGNLVINTFRIGIPDVYLRLSFVDPEGQIRPFPAGFPVTVVYGVDTSPPGTEQEVVLVQRDGRLSFSCGITVACRAFTLRFIWNNQTPYIVCEPPALPGSPPSALASLYAVTPVPPPADPPFLAVPAATASPPVGQRFFSVPPSWWLKQADWKGRRAVSPPVTAAPVFTGNGRFDAATGYIRQTVNPPANIGSAAAPVDFVLDPHWKHFRFEFFDRFYGPANRDSPPRAVHGRRVSIPAVCLEAFRDDPDAAGPVADTCSNWTIETAANDSAQCLPWIVVRTEAGAAVAPVLSGARMGLRFRTHPAQRTFVFSQTERVRLARHLDAAAAELRPGPDRLRYYDLPRLWKSRGYFVRRVQPSPPNAWRFFANLPAGEVQSADDRANPLVFSLDDMVLCQSAPPNAAAAAAPAAPTHLPAQLPAADRVALFNHRFDDSVPTSTANGVFRTQPFAAAANALELPYSNITVEPGNYINDYPNWTRAVIAQGSLWDTFDQRSPDDGNVAHAVGARAAVRWVDATAGLGINLQDAGGANFANGAIIPDRSRCPNAVQLDRDIGLGGQFPDRFDFPRAFPSFSIQPFYGQFRPDSRFQLYNENRQLLRGRFDIALLRCSDTVDGNEIAVNFHYIRSFFRFTAAPAVGERQYAHDLCQTVADRWNGREPAGGLNRAPTVLVPSPPLAMPLRVPVVWYLQSVLRARAHCDVEVVNINRDNRDTVYGGGASGPGAFHPNAAAPRRHTTAHESGHVDGLPDDYGERWAGPNAAAGVFDMSYRQLGLPANLPGDPFDPDDGVLSGNAEDSAMMQSNTAVRNRYLWHAAEWVRAICGNSLKVAYDAYQDYWLPPYQNAARPHRCYYQWPLSGGVDRHHPASAWSRFDTFLYAMGVDRYTSDILRHASPAHPFDGMLVFVLRIHCDLPANVNKGQETLDRTAILAAVSAAVYARLNYRWAASGDANYGSPPTLRHFDRCLLHFVPRFLVTNHPHDAAAAGWAASFAASFPAHFVLRIVQSAAASPGWNVGAHRLTIHIPNLAADPGPAAMARLGNILGIAKPAPPAPPNPVPAGSIDSLDLRPLVRLVIANGNVAPLP